jgi:hypothetical protein
MCERKDRDRDLTSACLALLAGEISESEFARRTAERWRRTARYLFSHFRRKLPAWVEPADVEQELALLSLRHVRKWDPTRANGKSVGQFVAWTTIHRAQRRIDHWRGASLNGNHGKNPSRAEIAFARAYSPEVDPLERLAGEDGREGAEERLDEYAEALVACEDLRDALALVALRRAGGEPSEAGRLLYGNYAARVELGLRSEEEARGVVLASVAVLAERVDRRAPEPPPDDLYDEIESVGTEAVA